jgi:hypothetical protein
MIFANNVMCIHTYILDIKMDNAINVISGAHWLWREGFPVKQNKSTELKPLCNCSP